MRFPVDDWQFWVATGAALVALIVLCRGFGLRRVGRRSRSTRVALTVEGRSRK